MHRHYPVYPVVDADRHVIGVVRGWRLFERQAIEISAQSGQMVGVDKEERLYTGIWTAFKMRHPWLQVNLLTAFAAGFVVSLFEGTLTQIVALAAFLPILAGQSGNTGCQALAITLRGMTLGDLNTHPVRKLIAKELTLGAMNGLLTGVIAGLVMWWSAGGSGNDQALILGLVILFAMIGACMASGLFGVLVPLTLRQFGADPCTASSIFLTTGTDIAGMELMLGLATVSYSRSQQRHAAQQDGTTTPRRGALRSGKCHRGLLPRPCLPGHRQNRRSRPPQQPLPLFD